MSIGSIDGLISGLSTGDIVNKIMAAERLRVTDLENKKKTNQARSDALRDLNTRLSSLQSAIAKLGLRSTMLGRLVTTNTPPNVNPPVTATASADAPTGSFTVRVNRLATASLAKSTAVVGAAVNTTVTLNQTNTSLGVTSGAFTINGRQFTVDVATNTLTDVVNSINAQTATTGVTATLIADADGRAANRLQLTTSDPVAKPIRLGSAGDTSSFLSAMKVLGAPAAGDGSITGQGAIGGVKLNELLQNAYTGTALAASGSFKINGVEIAYNASVDTLNDVISRINGSTAGVTASYDTISDRLVMTNNTSGALDITLAEGATGNFLTAFKLAGGGSPVTLGQTAQYSLDSGATWRYSSSNTIGDAVPGVTLTLKETSATDTTVSVNANPDGAVSAIKSFVDALNNTIDFIKEKTAFKNLAGKAEPLAGDSTVRSIGDTLRSLASSKALGLTGLYTSLPDVGITTGAIGSAVGSTNKLTVDETKLRAALSQNPSAVFDLFAAVSQVAMTTPGDVASVSGTPASKISGVYSITSNGGGTLSGTFTPDGGSAQALTGDGTITVNGTNTTLIPGLTLKGAATFTSATTTITVTARSGVAATIGDYIKSLTNAGGTISARRESIDSQQKSLDTRIRLTQERLEKREKDLYAQFARLEVALAKMQSQSSQLSAGLASLGAMTG